AGQIRIGSVRLDNKPPHAVARAGIARTFQSPKLMLRETALENVIPAVELRVRCLGLESVLRLPRGIRANRQARPEAQEILDTVTGLHQGKTLFQGTPEELRANTSVASVFLGLDEPLETPS